MLLRWDSRSSPVVRGRRSPTARARSETVHEQSAPGRTRLLDVSPAILEHSNHRSAVLACSTVHESATERQNAEYIEYTETIRCYRRQINLETTTNASKALLRPWLDDTRITSNWRQCTRASTQHVGPRHRHWSVRHPEVVRRRH